MRYNSMNINIVRIDPLVRGLKWRSRYLSPMTKPIYLVRFLLFCKGKGSPEICKLIKADPELRGIRVIILTAKGQELDRRDCMSAGADDYLTKPFSPREVLERVRALFSQG
jgi:DNA-binding response OmpR family regulator